MTDLLSVYLQINKIGDENLKLIPRIRFLSCASEEKNPVFDIRLEQCGEQREDEDHKILYLLPGSYWHPVDAIGGPDPENDADWCRNDSNSPLPWLLRDINMNSLDHGLTFRNIEKIVNAVTTDFGIRLLEPTLTTHEREQVLGLVDSMYKWLALPNEEFRLSMEDEEDYAAQNSPVWQGIDSLISTVNAVRPRFRQIVHAMPYIEPGHWT